MQTSKVRAFITIMRIPQWVKNAFIFLPAFFGGTLLSGVTSEILTPTNALLFGLTLILSGYLLLWFCLNRVEVMLITGYVLLNVLYSFFLKHIAIVDVLIIALGLSLYPGHTP